MKKRKGLAQPSTQPEHDNGEAKSGEPTHYKEQSQQVKILREQSRNRVKKTFRPIDPTDCNTKQKSLANSLPRRRLDSPKQDDQSEILQRPRVA